MIVAKPRNAATLAARLAKRARIIVAAHAENTLRARRRDPARWRDPRLIWPGSTADITREP